MANGSLGTLSNVQDEWGVLLYDQGGRPRATSRS